MRTIVQKLKSSKTLSVQADMLFVFFLVKHVVMQPYLCVFHVVEFKSNQICVFKPET